MKLLMTLLCLMLFFPAKGQYSIYRPKAECTIDSSNHLTLYQRARDLMVFNYPDSSAKAVSILRDLCMYDSTKYSIRFIGANLDTITNNMRAYYKKILTGNWKFEWSGSNWGTYQTAKERSATITFTDKEVIFYKGDSIARKTPYSIMINTSSMKSRFISILYFNIYFLDNKEEWILRIFDNEEAVPFVKPANDGNVVLYINQEPGCACGCPNEVYRKAK